MNSLKGESVIVTGVSHSKGIGAAICRKLAENGADIYFTYWQSTTGWAGDFRQEIIAKGVQCACGEIDLSKPNAPEQLLRQVKKTLGLPSILINNAAYSKRDGYQRLDAQILDDHYAVNVRCTLLLSTAFVRMYEEAGLQSGRIINLTSGQGQGPMMEELAYGATKGAISAFTLSLSAEVAHLGITVNAVNPGPTDTGWMTEEIKRELTAKFLMGRIGSSEDAAKLVTFLCSQDAGWITGQVINSEGGFLRK